MVVLVTAKSSKGGEEKQRLIHQQFCLLFFYLLSREEHFFLFALFFSLFPPLSRLDILFFFVLFLYFVVLPFNPPTYLLIRYHLGSAASPPRQAQLEAMSYPSLPTLTPQKPLPGAFFHTPAPNTVQNVPSPTPKQAPTAPAQAAPVSLPKFPPAASKTKNLSLSTEERGARTINDTLVQESRYPDLDTYLSRK